MWCDLHITRHSPHTAQEREHAVADDTNNPNPFDVATIKNLVALMSRHDLSEIDLSIGDQRIRLRRGPRFAAAPTGLPTATVSPTALPSPPPPTAVAVKEKTGPALIEIKSETPGTFYAKPDPDKPPFVTVGARVKPDTVVGLIEAMKLFNEIPAGCAGVVAEILVENGQPVEFGQVLFRVNPAG
jgi:acetyl-CoA carboxylase biotin carboxyl carrier protein